MNTAEDQDEEVLDLRSAGRPFATIAKALGYERAQDANEAFHRALRRRPDAERARLCQQEVARLDAMAERIRADPTLSPDDTELLVRAVDRLRALLPAG